MNITQEHLNEELKKYFTPLPPFEPYEVQVALDIGESKPALITMLLCYHENNNDLTQGYHIAYEPVGKEWHVLEYSNGKYSHISIGGKSLEDAFRAM